jgi:uncharacterized phage protein (TIGR01671 family)
MKDGMREIEFRGKREDTREWVYGYYYWDYGHKISLIKRDSRKHLFGEGAIFKVDPKTVGQYTGLKDRNGKKIFEGDIVEINYISYGKIRGVIRWAPKDCAFLLTTYSLVYVNEKPEVAEVLGNIHDSPKLVKKEARIL